MTRTLESIFMLSCLPTKSSQQSERSFPNTHVRDSRVTFSDVRIYSIFFQTDVTFLCGRMSVVVPEQAEAALTSDVPPLS